MAKKPKAGEMTGNTSPNLLTDDPNDFVLVLSGGVSRNLRDICTIALEQSNRDYSAEELEDVFNLVLTTAFNQVLSGNPVTLNLFSIRGAVSGVFNTSTEPFTKGKHELKLSYTSSAELMEVVQNTKVRNLGPAQNYLVTQVYDYASAMVNGTITPGGNVRIEGRGIKVGSNGDMVGKLFLVKHPEGTVAVSIPIENLVVNKPTEIIFQAPTTGLSAGSQYRVRVSTFVSDRGTPMKNQRIVNSDIVLTCL